MLAEMNINDVSRLCMDGMSASTQSGNYFPYRMPFEEIQNSAEFARHVCFYKFSDVWFVFNIYRE